MIEVTNIVDFSKLSHILERKSKSTEIFYSINESPKFIVIANQPCSCLINAATLSNFDTVVLEATILPGENYQKNKEIIFY